MSLVYDSGGLAGYNSTGNAKGAIAGAVLGGAAGYATAPIPGAVTGLVAKAGVNLGVVQAGLVGTGTFVSTNALIGGTSGVATSELQYQLAGGEQPNLLIEGGKGALIGAGSSVLEAPFVGFGIADSLGVPGALYLTAHTGLLGTLGTVIAYPPSGAPGTNRQ